MILASIVVLKFTDFLIILTNDEWLQVLRENNVKKEELKARALALKILGKTFQVQNSLN